MPENRALSQFAMCAMHDKICATGEQDSSTLEQLLDALHAGVMKIEQASGFSRIRAYLSTPNLAEALTSAHGNVATCLSGTAGNNFGMVFS